MLNHLIAAAAIVIALSLPAAAEQDAPLVALGQINADIVELNRLADYQAELIALAQEDINAAARARRLAASCARRPLVRTLCTALPVSFPQTLFEAQEPAQ